MMSIAVMSDLELDRSTFALVTARIRRGARCGDNHANGSGFSDRQGRGDGTPRSPRCARAILPAASLLRHISLPARRYRQLDLKHLKYKAIFAIIGWFFGLDFKFLPDSREVRERRSQTRPGPPRLASRRRVAPRANGRRRGGRGGFRASLRRVARAVRDRLDCAHRIGRCPGGILCRRLCVREPRIFGVRKAGAQSG
jgi:hypothetical protein